MVHYVYVRVVNCAIQQAYYKSIDFEGQSGRSAFSEHCKREGYVHPAGDEAHAACRARNTYAYLMHIGDYADEAGARDAARSIGFAASALRDLISSFDPYEGVDDEGG